MGQEKGDPSTLAGEFPSELGGGGSGGGGGAVSDTAFPVTIDASTDSVQANSQGRADAYTEGYLTVSQGTVMSVYAAGMGEGGAPSPSHAFVVRELSTNQLIFSVQSSGLVVGNPLREVVLGESAGSNVGLVIQMENYSGSPSINPRGFMAVTFEGENSDPTIQP